MKSKTNYFLRGMLTGITSVANLFGGAPIFNLDKRKYFGTVNDDISLEDEDLRATTSDWKAVGGDMSGVLRSTLYILKSSRRELRR